MGIQPGIAYKKPLNYVYCHAGDVLDNIEVVYGLTMIIEGSASGSAAFLSVGWSQNYMHVVSDPASLIGNWFNVEHGTVNGASIKITVLRNIQLSVIAVG